MFHPIMRSRSPFSLLSGVSMLLALAIVVALGPLASPARADEPAEQATALTPGAGVTMRNLAVRADGSPGPDPNGAPAGQNAWAIGPAGQEAAQPGNRPYFRYDVAPGGTVKDAVTLYNYSDNDLAFNIYPTDAFNTVGGGYDLLQANQKPTDVGSWVQLENEGMLVPKHHSVTIPFVMNVPANAVAGDHSGGVVASLVRGAIDPNSKEVVVEHRVGTRLYLRVTGAVAPDLVIDKLDSVFHGGGVLGQGDLEVTYTVRNAGNTRIRGHQQIDVGGAFGLFAQTVNPEDLPELLPGTTVMHTEIVRDVTPAFLVNTHLTITPVLAAGLSDTLPAPAERDTSVWSIPWLLLVGLVAIVVAWRVVRRRRTRARQTGSGGGGGRDPKAEGSGGGDGGGAAHALVDTAADDLDDIDLDDLLAHDPWEPDESSVDA